MKRTPELLRAHIKLMRVNPEAYQKPYDEMIDRCNAPCTIGSTTYSASAILKAIDYSRYHHELFEYLKEEITELEDELEQLKGNDL